MNPRELEPQHLDQPLAETAEYIRVRGSVQGVGFRPTVWRLAQVHGVRGSVSNDSEGVMIHACGSSLALDAFVHALTEEAPPLARIDSIERERDAALPLGERFTIGATRSGIVRTGAVPDAATCAACLSEIFDPSARRFRYPFTNCTHCGPRITILDRIPYERASTRMRSFPMCPACAEEYRDPGNRRFHAEPIACHQCGPRAWLERADGAPIALDALTTLDAVDAASTLLREGNIVAIKGLGGFQLACDATNEASVARLRASKHRERKAFALMVQDLETLAPYCTPTPAERALLELSAAPIVIMDRVGSKPLARSVAPGLNTLGFMLPNTPLHHLLLGRMTNPIVLTSGNLTDEPQCIDNEDARIRLGGIAEYFLFHDRDIARRVDDSVVRVVGALPRMLRRARGYAPAPIRLPTGFGAASPVLALGGELKNTFCLTAGGDAILSHHIGDLEDPRSYGDAVQAQEQYRRLFEHDPKILAIDLHPEYLSSKLGRKMAEAKGLKLEAIQHHHAHVAACLAENGVPLDTAPVLGVALDGLGFGADGTLWGGEFLLADYRSFRRLACFKPVAMPGGKQAIYEPWRNTYAHLMAELGWKRFTMHFEELELHRFLAARPRRVLDEMLTQDINAPLASSCGRLFDAVAAAAGVSRDQVAYEGQAAAELEALVDPGTLVDEDDDLAYPFAIQRLSQSGLPYIEPLAMWEALLGDLILKTPVPVIAARFHKGLALVMVRMIEKLQRHEPADTDQKTVILSGGVFQNRILLEQMIVRLDRLGFEVVTHRQVPCNDGGLALGQAAVAAARSLARSKAP